MSNNKKDFINLLEDLMYIYTDYINKYDNSRLDVNIKDNTIKVKLFKDNELMDEFGLAFNLKEKDSYRYISIVLMKILFGNKIIYSKDNVFYNEKQNIRIDVMDEEVFNRMFSMICNTRNVDFYNEINNGKRIRNKINRDRTAKLLDERINVTKKLFRVRDK